MKPERHLDVPTPNPLDPAQMMSLRQWDETSASIPEAAMRHEAVVDCGWGRLIFGHTFDAPQRLVEVLHEETTGRRDIALYTATPRWWCRWRPRNCSSIRRSPIAWT